ncbi:hypothetical protein TNCV_2017091 [Trichonephila clavipes]|nr:hypothetical protein TNCV_2017091 [Trichonephila clavipes]
MKSFSNSGLLCLSKNSLMKLASFMKSSYDGTGYEHVAGMVRCPGATEDLTCRGADARYMYRGSKFSCCCYVGSLERGWPSAQGGGIMAGIS